MKKILLFIAAMAATTLSFSQYFVEDFENGGSFPTGWGLSNGVDDWDIDMGNYYGPGSAQSGTYSAFFNDYDYSTSTTADMISSKIDLSLATNPELTFWYYDGSGSDDVQVLFSIDSSAFTSALTTSTTVTPWTKITIDMTLLAGQSSVWIAFRGVSVFGSTNPHIDNIVVAEPPTCPNPLVPATTYVGSDSAELYWANGGAESQWQVQYDTANFTLGTGSLVIANTKPFGINGLTPITNYEYYVRAVCGPGDSSIWIGPLAFTTTCPNFYTPSYSQDFTSYLPSCWEEARGLMSTNVTLTTGNSDWTYDGFANAGSTGSASLNIYGAFSLDGEWLISPSIDLGAAGTYQVEFDVALTKFSGTNADTMQVDDSLAFLISIDNGATWTSANIIDLWDDNNDPSNTGDAKVYSLASYTGIVKFAFYGNSSVSGPDNNVYIDNFVVRTPPSCADLSALNVTALTSTTADLNWTENGTATQWHVEYDTAGFSIGTGANSYPLNTNNPYNATGLTANTAYDFYARAICGPGDSSLWEGPFTFSTPCLPVVGDSINDAIMITGLTSSNTFDNNCYTNQYVGRSGDDAVFKIALDSCIDSLVLSTCGSSYDTYLYVLEDDKSTVVGDNDDSSPNCGPGGNSYLALTTVDFNGGDTIYIIVDGYDNTELGNAILDVEQILKTTTDAGFTYVTNLCSGDTAMPTLTGFAGGIYTAEAGITVDGVTGKVTSNDAGTFEVYYTVGASACSINTDTATIVVDSIDYTITMNADTAFAVVGAASYQWLDCSAGDTVITGATSSWYKAPVSGNYSVIIGGVTCTGDTSACATIAATSVNQLSTINFNMFPNPNNGDFVITTKGNEKDLTVDVMNTVGQVVYSTKLTTNTTNINLNNVAKGSYIVRIYNNNTSTQEILIVK
jgi:hypothetical protein